MIGEREELRSLIERYRAAPRGGRYRALADEIDTLFVGPDLRTRVRAGCPLGVIAIARSFTAWLSRKVRSAFP